ncbi:MAG: carbohydrate ABC transporter substrate-binding protein [Lachnospiraceae bacterium]|nr:carbohydrate ABC transporter substrate-binding protein [Lachnospiraceae bacterium]
MKKKTALILAGLLCALSIAACGPSESSSGKKAAEGAGNSSKLVIAISEQQEEFYRKAISKYCKLHPEVEVEIETVPFIDNSPTEKMEKNKKAVKDMQVQVMAGKGPDVFLLDESNQALPDMIKSSYGGVFLDLNTVIEDLKDLPLNQTVMKAGEVDGKQYFLPLGYMLAGVAAAEVALGDWEPSSGQPAQFLEEIAGHTGVSGFPTEFLLREYMPGLFGTPALDYEEETAAFSEELRNLAKLLDEGREFSSEGAPELPDVTMLGHCAGGVFESLVQRSFASGTDVKFLPFPNGEGGINAQVNVFGAVRANSPEASQAGDFLAFLLSDEAQGGTGWEGFGNGKMFGAVPVNNNAVVPALQYQFALGTGVDSEEAREKAEELFQITQQVTTARFCYYENSLVFQALFMTSEESSVEEKLDDLENELRFYFDE